jgi:hypothetical protein
VTSHWSLRLYARPLRQGDGLLQLLGDELVELRRRSRRRLDPDREQALLDVRELQDARGYLIEPVSRRRWWSS